MAFVYIMVMPYPNFLYPPHRDLNRLLPFSFSKVLWILLLSVH